MKKNRSRQHDLPIQPPGRQSPRGTKAKLPVNRPNEGGSRGSQKQFEDDLAAEHMREKKETQRLINAQRRKAGLSTD